MTDELLKETLWEADNISKALDSRYAGAEFGDIVNTKVESDLVNYLLPSLTEAFEAEQKAIESSEVPWARSWARFFVLISPDTAAYITIKNVFNIMAGRQLKPRERTMVAALGASWANQIAYEKWAAQEKKLGARYVARLSAVQRSRFLKRINKDFSEIEEGQGGKVIVGLGSVMLGMFMECFPDTLRTARLHGVTGDATLLYTDTFLQECGSLARLAAASRPLLRPTLIPPRPWTINQETGRYEGGYHLLYRPLVPIPSFKAHALDPSQAAIDALNQVQVTKWTVNHRALEFLKHLMDTGVVAQAPDYTYLPKLTDAEWAALTDEEKREVRVFRKHEQGLRVRQLSLATALARKVDIAETMVKVAPDGFYQPHHFDFRGRIYPTNTELTSQGDSWAKGLLQFAEGVKLGHSGLEALQVHLANCAGKDKLSVQDRVLWVEVHHQELMVAAMDFHDMWGLITEMGVDSPLPFAAAVWEYADSCGFVHAAEYVSHLPVAVDGTCNGLQILSLLGKDPVGAKSTNCTSDPERHDLYSDVSDAVGSIMAERLMAAPDSEEGQAAAIWQDHMATNGRKVVKRAVMTTPYGVTDRGIVEQLVLDHHCDELDQIDPSLTPAQNRYRLAAFMGQWTIEARADVVREAMKIMQYFKDLTAALADHGLNLSWTTPDGTWVKQGYQRTSVRTISTFRDQRRVMHVDSGKIDKAKASGACAPNVVHSLDADMLRTVVRRLATEGITEISMIHDSYGCHAAHVDTLQQIIREVAVDLFSGDWLAEFHLAQLAGLDSVDPGRTVELPLPPPPGDLDVAAELPKATYFFS